MSFPTNYTIYIYIYIYIYSLVGRAEQYTNYISVVSYELPNKCPGHDTKRSDGDTPVMVELWGM